MNQFFPVLNDGLINLFSLDPLKTALLAVLLYLVLFWFFVCLWVWGDSGERGMPLVLRILSVFLVLLFSLLGVFLYLALRPRETLEERARLTIEKEILAREVSLVCPHCQESIEKDFRFCPFCKKKLKKACGRCSRVFEFSFKLCPYCGEEKKLSL